MSRRVVILGAGFGGLELASRLSQALGDEVDVTLIDRGDAFVFGFAKLDLMFGRATADQIRAPYSQLAKPGVRFVRETITSIDPTGKRVTTADGNTYEGDVLVVALGADFDIAATPGLDEHGNEFYSVTGAERMREVLANFEGGNAIVGVCGPSFKCPPAPSETSLLLDDFLRQRGMREASSITLVMPFGQPVPPSPETSESLLARFSEAGVRFVPGEMVASVAADHVVTTAGTVLPCDLFFGIPLHRAPQVVLDSALAEEGWIPVDKGTLETRFPDVYAIGDVTSVGTAKAGVFAEGAARVVAERLLARWTGSPEPAAYDGAATCYIEFGNGKVARIDVDFLSGPSVTGEFTAPSDEVAAEKVDFKTSRLARWFGA